MKDTLLSQNETSSTTVQSPKNQQLTDSREEQKNKALKWIDKELKLGDKWFLINSGWYTRWANFVNLNLNNDNDSQNCHKSNSLSNFLTPDKINNKTLLDGENQLKHDLTEEVDYYTICEELWNYLVNIYGITQQEDIIERFVIDDGIDDETSLKIEIHRVKVNFSLASDTKVYTEEMSRQTTIEEVVDKLRIKFKLAVRIHVRLYFKSKDSSGNFKFHPVEISNKTTLNTSSYSTNEIICLDVQGANDEWLIEKTMTKSSMLKPESSEDMPQASTTNSFQLPQAPLIAPSPLSTQQQSTLNYSSTRHAYSNRQSHHDFRPGLCGLSNLGNTCFMNSSIQCMSNVPPLTDYFRSGDYKKEINVYNPLGRKGEIAEAYADLVNEMWSGNNSYTIPRNFKLHLSRFAPQFTGFQQQDSHELLAFLLDGLHEDLNRIIKKPYIELGSHVGKTDEQFAEESWQDHKKRNDSIIVDLFHGLLKSTLNCLECKEISIKFDPFCYLSLPLPSKKERLIEVYFVSLDNSVPLTKYKVSVVKNGTINDLCASLEQLVQVPKQRMCVCDVYTCKFFKVYDSTEAVTNIRERDDIYVYELATAYSNVDYLRVKVHLKEKSAYQHNSSYFGLPLYMMIPKTDLKYGTLYQSILHSLKRFLREQMVSSSEEINSKLNNSLNVRDEDWDEEIENKNKDEKEAAELNGTSGSKELNLNDAESEKLFNLIISKNDNIDYESFQQSTPLNNDSLIDWQNMNSNTQGNVPTTVSIIAEFGQNFAKRYYNKKEIDDYKEHPSCNAQLVKKKDVISLSDCFNLYTKTEDLSEQDYWYCSKCKQHQPSTKKFDLWSLPPVLVVHLKRFSYSRLYRDKIDTQVEFPLIDLDLSNYLINKNVNKTTKYNLIAVSNHYGSLGGGHYTAYAQNRFDSKWYNFDDSCVSSTEENSVCTSAAYLLIYLRQDIYHNGMSAESVNGKGSQAEKMDL